MTVDVVEAMANGNVDRDRDQYESFAKIAINECKLCKTPSLARECEKQKNTELTAIRVRDWGLVAKGILVRA